MGRRLGIWIRHYKSAGPRRAACGKWPRSVAAPDRPRGGSETNTLTVNNLPAHNHTASLHARAEDGTSSKPESNLLAAGTTIYGAGAQDATMASDAISVANTGAGQAVNNMQPFLVINWCIALTRLYPSRN